MNQKAKAGKLNDLFSGGVLKNPIVSFIIKFVLLYAVLLFIFSLDPVKDATRERFIKSSKTLRSKFAGDGRVYYAKDQTMGTGSTYYVLVQIMDQKMIDEASRNRKPGQTQINVEGRKFTLELYNLIVLPLLFLIALILATPIPWKRKLIGLAVGMLLLFLFVYFKLTLKLVAEANLAEWLKVAVLNGGIKTAMFKINYLLSSIGLIMIVPVFIWLITCFRRDDWASLNSKLENLKG